MLIRFTNFHEKLNAANVTLRMLDIIVTEKIIH